MGHCFSEGIVQLLMGTIDLLWISDSEWHAF